MNVLVTHFPASIESKSALVFFLVSLYALATYGINVDSFLTYNIYYGDIFSNPEKYTNTSVEFILTNIGIGWFTSLFELFLSNPIWTLVLGLLLNTVALYIGFQVVKTQLEAQQALFFVIIVGIVIHGYFPGFDSSEIIFDRKSIVGALLVLTTACMLKNNILGLLLTLLLGIVIHPLDLLTGLLFLVPGYMVYAVLNLKEKLGRISFVFIVLIFVTAVLYSHSGGVNSDELPSITEWYRFSLLIEVGDVALFEMFRTTIGVNGAVILLASALSWSTRSDHKLLDYFCLSFIPLITLILIVEWGHYIGFSLPKLSEIFLILQFRRGLWIVTLISLLRVFVFVFENSKEGRSKDSILVGVFFSAILVHSLLALFAGLIAFFLLQRNKRSLIVEAALVIGLVMLLIQIILQLEQIRWPGEWQKVILVSILIVTWTCFIHRKWTYALTAIVFLYSSIMLGKNNLVDHVFAQSWATIAPADSGHQVVDFPVAVMSRNAGEQKINEIDVLLALNKIDDSPSSALLFSAISLGYGAPVIAKQKMLFSRWDNTLVFKRELFPKYISQLKGFGVDTRSCTSMYGAGFSCFMEALGGRIDQMNLPELIRLAKEYNFNYVARRTELNLNEIYRNSEFILYKIPTEN